MPNKKKKRKRTKGEQHLPMPYRNQQQLLDAIERYRKPYIEPYFQLRVQRAAIYMGADATTFRAYRHTAIYTPSTVYRMWVFNNFYHDGVFIQEMNAEGFAKSISTKRKYKQFHDRVCQSFEAYWKEINNGNGSIDYGQQRKLVDLWMKSAVLLKDLREDSRKALVKVINVPLDQYSLYLLKHLYHQQVVKADPELKNLPTVPSMGWVKDEKHYWAFQLFIQKLSGRYPAIYYDFVAWNSTHPRIVNLETVVKRNEKHELSEVVLVVKDSSKRNRKRKESKVQADETQAS